MRLLACARAIVTRQKWQTTRFGTALSATSTRFDLRQGGLLVINLKAMRTPQMLEVVSAWQDCCVVDVVGGNATDADAAATSDTDLPPFNMIYDVPRNRLAISPNAQTSSARLRITVPQSIDLDITASEVHLSIKNKIEGDVTVDCAAGSVEVDKIRGMNLSFNCGQAALKVHKLLEGNVQIAAGAVEAKMINGDTVHVASLGDCTVEAMYVQQCQVAAHGEAFIGTMNGHAVVHSRRSHVTLKGIDGSFDVLADEGNIALHVNKLVPGMHSCAHATMGRISAQVDPEIVASIKCESLGIAGRAKVAIISDAFQAECAQGAQGGGQRAQFAHPRDTLVVGRLTGKSAGAKRQGRGAGGTNGGGSSLSGGVGKIDLHGAALQALAGYGRGRGAAGGEDHTNRSAATRVMASVRAGETVLPDPAVRALYSTDAAATSAIVGATLPAAASHFNFAVPPAAQAAAAPDLTLTAHGHVTVETLSWFEAIRRKHGIREGEGSLPPGAGRTARAAERARGLRGEGERV